MMSAARSLVRGHCPGALQPMESGDGLIVRVRLHAARLSVGTAAKLAEAAALFGNGEIDLTRRANLQIRGVTPATLEPLQSALDVLGLLDASAEVEATRNILVSPLAGIDPTEHMDATALALALEARLAADRRLWNLPGKFGFLVDGGGVLSLDSERADIRLKAVSPADVAIGIGVPDGVCWLGTVGTDRAAEVATRLALGYLATQPSGSRLRMSEISQTARATVVQEIASDLQPLTCATSSPMCRDALGVLKHDDVPFAVGLGAPFGRASAGLFGELARAAEALGATELRVSPWRSLFVEVSDTQRAAELLSAARRLGFMIDAADPMSQIEACPGRPACRSASLDTRSVARRLASRIPRSAAKGSLHISGCPKGCACSEPRPWVLVGSGDRIGIIRNGRADDAPALFIPAAEIERIFEMLEKT